MQRRRDWGLQGAAYPRIITNANDKPVGLLGGDQDSVGPTQNAISSLLLIFIPEKEITINEGRESCRPTESYASGLRVVSCERVSLLLLRSVRGAGWLATNNTK